MRKYLAFMMVLALAGALPRVVRAGESIFSHDSISTQIAMDSFNNGVKNRLEVARFGFYGDTAGTPASERWQSNSGKWCGLGSGMTLWGEGYYTWAKQKARGGDSGYRYRVGGPALGLDWTNGPLTFGIASTYAWGTLKGLDTFHKRDTRTWGITAYGQMNYERFYVNGMVSYGYNKFKSRRNEPVLNDTTHTKYHSHAWNGQLEVGTRLNICNFLIEPHIGIRYFNNRNNKFNEIVNDVSYRWNRRSYHTLEMPLGVDVGYQVALGTTMLMPRLRFAWVPQWDRKYPKAARNGATVADYYQEDTKARAKHGFIVGAGFQAKISEKVMAHVDYNVNMRTKAYEHTINAGVGLTF